MRKDILILGHNYATQFIDIYNQYTRLFDQEKYTVTVAYLTGEADEKVRQRTLAENVVFLNTPKKNIRYLKMTAIQTVMALCKNKNFQLVICHRYKPTYIMLWVAQFLKIPAIIFVMHELETVSAFKRKALIALLHRKNMQFAGVSNAVRDDMRSHLWRVPHTHISTLYNVIDVDLTVPQFLSRDTARAKLHLASDDFVFGHIARLAPNKDHASLINAFDRIRANCPKAKLVIIGDGALEATLKKHVEKLSLQSDIYFTGFLPHAFSYMLAFDCFILPSIQEAFGRVLLEAMLAKRPIIATRVHGIPEVVGDAGLLVAPNNYKELANAMHLLYALPAEEREQWGEKAYQRALTRFSIPAFKEQFWQLPMVQSIKE